MMMLEVRMGGGSNTLCVTRLFDYGLEQRQPSAQSACVMRFGILGRTSYA
jgi:hypothetical protein